MFEIIEKGSWSAEDDVQSMWAGLLASSCTPEGKDESSLIFVHLLGQITSAQARLLRDACERAEKKLSVDGLLYAQPLSFTPDELYQIWQDKDLHRVDRELDHLRALELIAGGFPLHGQEFIEQQQQEEEQNRELERGLRELRKLGDRFKKMTKQGPSELETETDEYEPPIIVKVPPLRAEITPTSIALQLYVRCEGSRKSPSEFFGLRVSHVE